MQTFDIQICMISGQPTPNLVPALSLDMRPKCLVMLVSNEMKQQAKYLKNVLDRYHIQTREEVVDNAYDIDAISHQIHDLITKLGKEEDKPSIALNLTGGTKPMAIAAQTVCFYENIPYFYIRPDTNEVQLYLPAENRLDQNQIEVKLKLRDYLGVHGFTLTPQSASVEPALSKKMRNLQKVLVLNAESYSESIGALNALANEAEQKKSLRISIPEHVRSPHFERLLDEFVEAGIVSVSGDSLSFKSEDARFFANGGWLEDFVFEQVMQLPLQDRMKNCEVSTQSKYVSKNEMDVAFLANNRLFLIECKTRNFNRDKKIGQDTLYKLTSLLPDLGGLNARGMLVSYRQLDDATRKRANDNRIKVVEASQLHDLKNHISTWISQ